MKIIVAADSFKGSLSSKEIGEIFVKAASDIVADAEVVGVEIADGGEGTLDAVLASGKFTTRSVECSDPLFSEITAQYGISGDIAFIEMAKASGLTLIPYAEGNALRTTTYGTGELIKDAVLRGAKEVVISVGGSATNDGGIGALAALGYSFKDKEGKEVLPVGSSLGKIATVDDSRAISIESIKFTVLTDVNNPLVGATGATYFYGKQKGAAGKDADFLEAGMVNYAEVVERYNGVKLKDMAGAGAAGGLAGGLRAFLGAELRSGIEAVLDLISFDAMLDGAAAVITGEGRIDDQSTHGKAISGVCMRAKKHDIPVYAMAGCSIISSARSTELGLKAIYSLSDIAVGIEDSIKNAKTYAEITARKILEDIFNGVKE